MNKIRQIVVTSIVRPFYRKTAGLWIFIVFIMFIVVGYADGVGLLGYHYALIMEMLKNPGILMLAMLLWLLYGLKCLQFVAQTMTRREYDFLYALNVLSFGKLYFLLLLVEVLLFLPISTYATLMVVVGFYQHLYGAAGLVIIYILLICFLSAAGYLYLIRRPGTRIGLLRRLRLPRFISRYYWNFPIRYVRDQRKLLFLGIKAYNCTTLCLMLLNRDSSENFMQMVFLFYGFGLFGHCVLIYELRKMEDKRLTFYRGLPVSLWKRWLQYAGLYFLLLVPELSTILRLAPGFLGVGKILVMIFYGYGLLLLLNSLLFIRDLKRVDYFKLITVIFFIVVFCLVAKVMAFFVAGCLLFSIYLFFSRYYRYEPGIEP